MPTQLITAGALLVNSHEQILFGRRASWKKAWPDCWDAIGGRLEPGETPLQAVIREVEEEVGVTPTVLRLLEALPEVRPDLYGDATHYIFAVTSWRGGEPTNQCDEHSELCWFSLDQLANLTPLAGQGYLRLSQEAVNVSRFPFPLARARPAGHAKGRRWEP